MVTQARMAPPITSITRHPPLTPQVSLLTLLLKAGVKQSCTIVAELNHYKAADVAL